MGWGLLSLQELQKQQWGSPGELWAGEEEERRGEEGAQAEGSATHHLAPHRHSNTSLLIESNYFPFPFIMISTWRLCWIKYWLLLTIFINTHTHIYLYILHIYIEIFPHSHTSQTFFLAQYGPKTEPPPKGPARCSFVASEKSAKPRGWFLCW